MEVVINGASREVPSQISLQELIRWLELTEDRVAVELNRQIIRRESWDGTRLQDHDRLEIVQFVGGG